MGVELRRVPADWEHPTKPWHGRLSHPEPLAYHRERFGEDRDRTFKPLHDESWVGAYRRWVLARAVWFAQTVVGFPLALLFGKALPPYRADFEVFHSGRPEYSGPYRPRWRERERTHVQLYETVSEGTPISPVLPSVRDLADWCAEQTEAGLDVWVETAGMTRAAWARFFERGGWAPSGFFSEVTGYEPGVRHVAEEGAPR